MIAEKHSSDEVRSVIVPMSYITACVSSFGIIWSVLIGFVERSAIEDTGIKKTEGEL